MRALAFARDADAGALAAAGGELFDDMAELPALLAAQRLDERRTSPATSSSAATCRASSFATACAARRARLGVAGWVRNCRDGTVEAHLEGAPDAVAALVLWCREGPRHATVDELRVGEVDAARASRASRSASGRNRRP